MMLPGVRNRITDGALGVLGADATGRFAAIGVSSKFGSGIRTLTDASDVDAALGDGPLRDTVMSALSIARTTVYALPLEGTVPGTLSAVVPGSDNEGGGTLSVSGSPRNEYDVRIDIVRGGVLNEATFRATIDGRTGKETTVPDVPGVLELIGDAIVGDFIVGDSEGDYTPGSTGITMTFAPGTGFVAGDTFAFSASAPAATNGEVLAAVDTILAAKLDIEWIAVAGVSDATLWAALATKADYAAGIYQYLFFVAQARNQASDETVDEWATALAGTERGSVASTRLQVCAGWIEEADPNGQVDVRGLIGTYCGMLAARRVHQGPDAVRFGAISAATALAPSGIDDGHIETLKNAGYVTARRIIGLRGIYITSGQMMSEEGSDFDLVERRRTMDKACRLVRRAQLIWVNDAVAFAADGSPEGLKMLIAQSQGPLKTMVTAEEISSGVVDIPPGQDILSTKTVRTKVRIVPLGKVSYIENEIAFSKPVAAAPEPAETDAGGEA